MILSEKKISSISKVVEGKLLTEIVTKIKKKLCDNHVRIFLYFQQLYVTYLYLSIGELVKGERHNVEEMVKNYADTPDAMNNVVTSYILLKK